MRPSQHSVSMHYARALLASAHRNGLDVPALLDAAGLDEAVANKSHLRMTDEQYSKLLLKFWRDADDEYFGMSSGQCHLGTFTMMAKQAVTKPDIRSVYIHTSRFYHLVNKGLRMHLDEGEQESAFVLKRDKPELDPDNTLIEFSMLMHHRFPSWLSGQRIPLLRVELTYPKPNYHEEIARVFPYPLHFESKQNALVMETDFLAKPVIQTPQSLRKHLKNSPLNWISSQTYSPQFTRKALDFLGAVERIGEARIDDLAEALHTTSRTLRRRLTEEQTSFQELKDRVRRDKAIHLLSLQGKLVSEVSDLLGFSDTAAFSRAFKTWTGVSPSDYRTE